eukprot:4038188-Ditylum_brightwellii.AAC.1
MINMYRRRGFKITAILTDTEFEALRPHFPMINTSAAGKHIPGVEQCIHTVKERTRAGYSLLPFKYVP